MGSALESIRVQAVNRGKGNKRFRDMKMATLELLLPRESRKVWIPTDERKSSFYCNRCNSCLFLVRICEQDPKTKTHLETKLDVLVQELMDRYTHSHTNTHTHTHTQGHTTDQLCWCL